MSEQRFRIMFAAMIIPRRDDEVLLALRQNTGWADGMYHFVGGHVDGGETATEAVVRETTEEIGIIPDIKKLKLAGVTHRLNDRPEDEYVSLYFETRDWTGEIDNKEPEKCADLKWFNIHNLPDNMMPHIRSALESYAQGNIAFLATRGVAA